MMKLKHVEATRELGLPLLTCLAGVGGINLPHVTLVSRAAQHEGTDPHMFLIHPSSIPGIQQTDKTNAARPVKAIRLQDRRIRRRQLHRRGGLPQAETKLQLADPKERIFCGTANQYFHRSAITV